MELLATISLSELFSRAGFPPRQRNVEEVSFSRMVANNSASKFGSSQDICTNGRKSAGIPRPALQPELDHRKRMQPGHRDLVSKMFINTLRLTPLLRIYPICGA